MRLLARASLLLLATMAIALVITACSGPERSVVDETPEPDEAIEPTERVDPTPTESSSPETPEQPGPTSPPEIDTEEPTDIPESTTPPEQGETPVVPPEEPTAPDTPTTPAEETSPPVTDFDPGAVTVSYREVGSGFEQPVFVTGADDGSGRIFVLEKVGRVRLLDGTTVLDIRDRVVQTGVFGYEHEQGMLGLAFHPQFGENGYLYVHYNDTAGDHVFSRFTMSPDGTVDPTTEFVFLTMDQPEVNFQGGMLLFGADGYLYMGTGTGGTAVELQHQAQDLGSLYGKILRIDVDTGDPYGIPPDNPFVDVDGARPEVWTYGLRNPWRFAFDTATGDLYIGGPGQFTEEWIDYAPVGEQAGENFGWPMYEGTQCWEDWVGPCDPAGLRFPVLTYPTYANGNCVVIGGYVYRGTASPLLNGAYFFGDFCSGRVWAGWRDPGDTWQMTEVFQIDGFVGSFGEDDAGEVYVCDINNGVIYLIEGN